MCKKYRNESCDIQLHTDVKCHHRIRVRDTDDSMPVPGSVKLVFKYI
jgi:hypothetical protein